MIAFNDNAFGDDAVLTIASFASPTDLLSLALTCRRFGSKLGGTGEMASRDTKRQKLSPLRDWSLMEEAARCIIDKTQTGEEKACLPLIDGESWMSRYNELHLLREPLTFDQLVGSSITYADGNKATVMKGGRLFGLAVSDHVMRAGKHYATFTNTPRPVAVGVLRPIKNWNEKGLTIFRNSYPRLLQERTNKWGNGNVHICMYSTGYGNRLGSDWSELDFTDGWHGMERLQENDVLGLLLDLDQGTLTVYKNGRRVGVMKDGLTGEYCWGAFSVEESTFSIKRGSIPG